MNINILLMLCNLPFLLDQHIESCHRMGLHKMNRIDFLTYMCNNWEHPFALYLRIDNFSCCIIMFRIKPSSIFSSTKMTFKWHLPIIVPDATTRKCITFIWNIWFFVFVSPIYDNLDVMYLRIKNHLTCFWLYNTLRAT